MSATVYLPENGGWKKHENNPVLGSVTLGTCFDVYVMEEAGAYRMYFSWRDRKSLAVATGTDGIHWSEPRIILEPLSETGWEDDLNRNCVVKRGDGWHMWYTGQSWGRHSWIGYAVSDDGYHWRRVGSQPVLYPERPYEGASVMNPCVLWDEDSAQWRMYYSAGETYEPNVIAYATSADGVNWVKRPANPVNVPIYAYEKNRLGACHVFRCDDWHYMFYIGYTDIHTARICLARSKNGITGWQRHPSNPLISPTAGGWDGDACYKPHVLWQPDQNRWLLWYNGRRDSSEYIGLAVHNGYDLGFGA